MATSNDNSVAATPTLMGIPPECRARIFEFVFEGGVCMIEVTICGVLGAIRDRHANLTGVPHPVLLVSRQIYNEAIKYYRITLSIRRVGHGPSLAQDDLRANMPLFLRLSVSKVNVDSVYGYQGQHVNQEQFPNLKTVKVMSLAGPFAAMQHHIEKVDYTFTPTTHFGEVWDGSHDVQIAAAAKTTADEHTMHNVPSIDTRTFQIICSATITINEAAADVLSPSLVPATVSNSLPKTQQTVMVSLPCLDTPSIH